MLITILPVSNKSQFKDFLKVPFNLHKHDSNWVPPLNVVMKKTFDKKNPFFKNAMIQSWVAYKNSKPVGRISGIINHVHNNVHCEEIAFWGFFEVDNCPETSRLLFKEVEQWAKQHKMKSLRGPMNPSTNHECGLQISAFDTKPYIMMTQNPAYYPEFVEAQGYQKIKDLQAWLIDAHNTKMNPKLIQKIKNLQARNHVTIRTIDMKRFDQELKIIYQIYNEAWSENWGYIPVSEEEYLHTAKDLKSIIFPKMIYILEVAGKPAAFSVWLPDLNQALIHIRDGNLFPTGIFKLLWHTKIKNKINQGRIPLLGIRKEYHHLPLGGMMYVKYLEDGRRYGYPMGECSWILEDNASMQSGLRLIDAKHYKTYRIYEKSLAE
ncbi:MAG: N-acetyltransferase [Gammaproteobacteria bacterium]